MKLEFFSGQGGYDNNKACGYDGSMTVATFAREDCAAHAKSMNCIRGPVVIIVTFDNVSPQAFSFNLEYNDDMQAVAHFYE